MDSRRRDLPDNGPKWGSYVKKNPDGSFDFDERMKRERPGDWDKMMKERMEWLKPMNYEIGPWTQIKKSRSSKRL